MPTLSPVARGGILPERLRAMVNEMVSLFTASTQSSPQGKVLTSAGTELTPTWEAAGGVGDMLKSTYDPDADGVIAIAQLASVLVPVQSAAPGAAVGRLYYDVDDGHLYLCTST